MVCLLRGSLLWVGGLGYDKKPHLEVHKNRLNRKIGPLSGQITGGWVSVFGVIRPGLGMFYTIM